MMAYNISEQINPWTFRGAKKQYFQEKKQTKPKSQPNIVPIRCQESNNPPYLPDEYRTQVLKQLRLPVIVQSPLSKDNQRSVFKQYGHLLNEEMRRKFIPNYSKVKITFRNVSKNKKNRGQSLPSRHKILKQFVDNSQLMAKQQRQNDSFELKRHKTQTICQQQLESLKVKRASSLERKPLKTLTVEIEQHDQTLKVINYGKFPLKDGIPNNGKTSDQASQQPKKDHRLNYKLSLMKRTYNLAKIQKMLL